MTAIDTPQSRGEADCFDCDAYPGAVCATCGRRPIDADGNAYDPYDLSLAEFCRLSDAALWELARDRGAPTDLRLAAFHLRSNRTHAYPDRPYAATLRVVLRRFRAYRAQPRR